MLDTVISGVSILLQVVAFSFAVRLIFMSERQVAWVTVSFALFLMAFSQAFALYESVMLESDTPVDRTGALIDLASSGLLALGLSLIRSFLNSLQRTKEELEKKDQQFRLFVENSPSEFTLKDLDGNYLLVNPQFLKANSWKEGEHIGKTIFDALPIEAAMDALSRESKAAETREVLHSESTMKIGGRDRHFLVTKFPVFEQDGSVKSIGSINTDITDRVEAERALSEALNHAETANDAKSNFLAMMSHEFRTPLNVMIGFSEVMKKELFGPLGAERYREYAVDIHTSGVQMLELVDDILDLSAIEAGKTEVTKVASNLNALVCDTVRRFQPQADEKELGVSTDCASNLPVLYVDTRAVRQILENLVSNAIKYTENGGKIKVVTACNASEVTLTVEDTGIGIPDDKLAMVTEPFVRANNDALVSNKGTGLGLSIVKKNVEAHGGVMEIQSAVGTGTVVSIVFFVTNSSQTVN